MNKIIVILCILSKIYSVIMILKQHNICLIIFNESKDLDIQFKNLINSLIEINLPRVLE